MAQFDFYPQRGRAGYWLDCQCDTLDQIDTRFVIPLIEAEFAPDPIRHLNPMFEIKGKRFVLFTQQGGPIAADGLSKPAGSLAGHRFEILNAIDFLVTGV